MDFLPLDHDFPDPALIDFVQELGERNVLRYRPLLPRVLKKREQRQQQQDNDHPKGEIAKLGIHSAILPHGVTRVQFQTAPHNTPSASASIRDEDKAFSRTAEGTSRSVPCQQVARMERSAIRVADTKKDAAFR
jgi:hypothetical protein